MQNKKIKKIASLLAAQTEIPQDVVIFLSKNLTKSELKLLGKHIRLETKKRTVTVSSSVELSELQKKAFIDMNKGFHVIFSTDKTFGAGIRVTKQDTVIDMSIKNYIIQMVQALTK